MTMMDRSIFGMRFHSNEAIHPGPGELAAFLDTRRSPATTERHRDDLAAYVDVLGRVEAYEAGGMELLGGLSLDERMALGVFSHAGFFSPGLRIAVEEYKFHLARLEQADVAKPAAFIRTAEEELRKLDQRRKEDQQKIARLTALMDQRKRDLGDMERLRRMLTGELVHIALYVRDNLAKVRKRCEEV